MGFHVAVDMHVLLQVALVTEASTADVTLKGLFASVRSFVVVVSTATHEELLTVEALPFSLL
jgi:hypothetical protein